GGPPPTLQSAAWHRASYGGVRQTDRLSRETRIPWRLLFQYGARRIPRPPRGGAGRDRRSQAILAAATRRLGDRGSSARRTRRRYRCRTARVRVGGGDGRRDLVCC